MGRGILLGLAIAGLAAVLYQFAYTLWGLLDAIPMDYIWGLLFVLIVCGWVYYAKWLIGVFNRARRERKARESGKKDYQRKQLIAVLSPMHQLEKDLQEGTLDSRPGSLGARAVGLEQLDEALGLTEGDM